MSFPSIRIEGQIFSGELLEKLDQPDTAGQRPTDFGLPPDVKVKDEIARAWAASQSYYRAFKAKTAIHETPSTKNQAPSTFTTETRNLWLVPFLSLLGYNPAFARKGEEVNGKLFPISHRDETRDGMPLHILGWNDSLDHRRSAPSSPNTEHGTRNTPSGPRMSPHALVQEYLNLTEHLYGLVTNGRTLRLLRDSTRLVRQSFIEFDLERLFEEDLFADFAVLFRLLHATRLPAKQADVAASLIEKYHQDALDQGARIRDGLRDSVEDVLVLLGTGFLKHPANEKLRNRLETGYAEVDSLTPKEYYQNLLRLVYRLLFLFVAEERGLLFPANASPRHRAIYSRHYSLARLRRLAERPHLVDKVHSDHWQGLLSTFRLFEFDGPGEKLGISPLGGYLFSAAALGPLADAALGNADLIQALGKLCFFARPDRTRSAVNFGALATEELGSVYESLLELNPVIEGKSFSFRKAAGNERKTSGSYYTPDSLVQCLLDSALEPVMDDAIKGLSGPAAADAILKLRACDPACGSGHFLVSAAHRMARRIARLRANGDEPSPADFRLALREVVSRCIYGVDINPMAVELCKVSLWLEAMDPGKPLTFLDHHVQCGNSLLGATPGLMSRGIPDEAFEPIEGDDKKYCSQFKKQNKQERTGQMNLFATDNKPWEHLGNLATSMMQVDSLPDATPADVLAKEKRYADLVRSTGYESGRQLADAWCSAFVWKKGAPAAGGFDYPITHDLYRRMERNPFDAPKWMRDEIHRLANQYNFFHWHLAFPEVFQPLETIEPKDSNGWKGGFDAVLGNPPWERTAFEAVPYFVSRVPEIANAETTSKRQALIGALSHAQPEIWDTYQNDLRGAEGSDGFYCHSGRFPFSASGRTNTFALFTELSFQITHTRGRDGLIIPSALATDTPYAAFWGDIIENRTLITMFDFENRGIYFPNVHRSYKFSLFTFRPIRDDSVSSLFGFFLDDISRVHSTANLFRLRQTDVAETNPITKLLPVCRSIADFALLVAIHRRSCLLNYEASPWVGLTSAATSGDWKFQEDDESPQSGLSLMWEAKCVHQFNHRYSSYEGTTRESRLEGEPREFKKLADPSSCIGTRYHIPSSIWLEHLEGRQAYLSAACGYRDVARSTDERTVIAAIIPFAGFMQPLNGISHDSPDKMLRLVGCLNSFALDYCGRQKTPGTHVNVTICKQLPIIGEKQYGRLDSALGGCASTWVSARVLELTYTAWDLEPFARDCGWSGPPFRWDEERRFWLRAELDAAFFHLYLPSTSEGDWKPARIAEGAVRDETDAELAALKAHFPKPRDAVAYIMDTFPIVRRKDEAKHGTYRTKNAILEIYDALQTAIRTGQPYQTKQNPPPADQSCRHPKLKIGILAYGSLIGDPGDEIAPKIKMRIKTQTPFSVEYGRFSKSRGGAPTLVPHPAGAPVKAEILVLDDSVTLDEALDMLWRRERRKEGTGEKYKEGTSKDSVLVRPIDNDPCVTTVLYTDFHPEGKDVPQDPTALATAAIASVKKAEEGKDGVTYLIKALAADIKTPLTDAYRDAILEQTSCGSLEKALEKATRS